jgi:hypothetical protein
MYDRVMVQERIGDLVRDAEAYRRSTKARRARAGHRRDTIIRVKSAIVSIVLWPVRH